MDTRILVSLLTGFFCVNLHQWHPHLSGLIAFSFLCFSENSDSCFLGIRWVCLFCLPKNFTEGNIASCGTKGDTLPTILVTCNCRGGHSDIRRERRFSDVCFNNNATLKNKKQNLVTVSFVVSLYSVLGWAVMRPCTLATTFTHSLEPVPALARTKMQRRRVCLIITVWHICQKLATGSCPGQWYVLENPSLPKCTCTYYIYIYIYTKESHTHDHFRYAYRANVLLRVQ